MSLKSFESDKEISEINMTPFVDIVLVLLVVFMATATLIVENRIRLELPESGSTDSEIDERDKVVISVDVNKTLFVDNLQTSINSLPQLLKNKKAVTIRADAKTEFSTVVAVIDECKKAKILKYQIDTFKK